MSVNNRVGSNSWNETWYNVNMPSENYRLLRHEAISYHIKQVLFVLWKNYLLISPNGHSLNHLKKIHMHHSSSNICLPWTLKVTLSFNIKNGGMPFVMPSDNPNQQTRSVWHKNLSQQHIMIYINFSSQRTPIQTPPQQNKTNCRTPCTLEMCYGLIPPLWSNIVNPSITSKPRWRVRFD